MGADYPRSLVGASPLVRPAVICGSRAKTRTWNLPVNSRLLCQLSYAGLATGEAVGGASVGYRTPRRGFRPRPPLKTEIPSQLPG